MTEVVCLTIPTDHPPTRGAGRITDKPICLAKATIVAFTDYRILLMGGVWLDVQESYAEIMAAYEGATP